MGRIWVNPDGLRVDCELSPGFVKPGGCWEDEGGFTEHVHLGSKGFQSGQDDEGADEDDTAVLRSTYREELAELRRKVNDLGCSPPKGPSLVSRLFSWGRDKLVQAARPVPTIAAWTGIIATVWWHAFQSLPSHPFEGIIDLSDETPDRYVAAGLETLLFCVWTLCFRHTVRIAIRQELVESKE